MNRGFAVIATRRNIPEDGILHSHCREYLTTLDLYPGWWYPVWIPVVISSIQTEALVTLPRPLKYAPGYYLIWATTTSILFISPSDPRVYGLDADTIVTSNGPSAAPPLYPERLKTSLSNTTKWTVGHTVSQLVEGRKVTCPISDELIGIFNWPIPFSLPLALASNQYLIVVSENLLRDPRRLTILWASTASYRHRFYPLYL
jgi:hypothetical protein